MTSAISFEDLQQRLQEGSIEDRVSKPLVAFTLKLKTNQVQSVFVRTFKEFSEKAEKLLNFNLGKMGGQGRMFIQTLILKKAQEEACAMLSNRLKEYQVLIDNYEEKLSLVGLGSTPAFTNEIEIEVTMGCPHARDVVDVYQKVDRIVVLAAAMSISGMLDPEVKREIIDHALHSIKNLQKTFGIRTSTVLRAQRFVLDQEGEDLSINGFEKKWKEENLERRKLQRNNASAA